MSHKNHLGLTRRNFVAATAAAGSAMALAIAGCSPKNEASQTADGEAVETKERTISQNESADLVVVGSGPAGLSAAIEAGELGLNVILLESRNVAGGNTDLTEGLMGINSFMTKRQGVEIAPMEIVNKEIRQFRYLIDPLMWKDMAMASGDNIQWLFDHGVEFEDEVVDYSNNPNNPPIYHMWKLQSSPAAALISSAEAAGVKILLNTAADEIIMDNNKVVGIYGNLSDGTSVKIDCAAIVLATGGYVDNPEMMKRALHIEDRFTRSLDGHNGDAVRMASAVGARDTTADRTLMGYICCRGLDIHRGWYPSINVINDTGRAIWVNQDGLRFTNEGCVEVTPGLPEPACLTQQESYSIFDMKHINSISEEGFSDSMIAEVLEAGKSSGVSTLQEGLAFLFDEGIKDGVERLWKADTIEELVEKSGLPKDALLKTITTYNDYCANGVDEDFEKDASMLASIDTPPYYMCQNGFYVTTTLGGLDYNRKMEVLTPEGDSIPGLYVAGVDGAKIYKTFYTLDTSGSCNANNIYTGRAAAQNAAEYISA